MYQVIELYGDNEPWWFLDNWQQDIQQVKEFSSKEEARVYFQQQQDLWANKYHNQKSKTPFLVAFWDDKEIRYCDDCEDDLQQYHGLMLLKAGKMISEDGKDSNETTYYHGEAKCCQRSSQSTRCNTKK